MNPLNIGNENIHNNPRIIIIGAGAAGVAAASKLFENGFKNVTILEAENRIGGRIYTARFGDQFVDLGSQWVHGEIGNVAFELASPFGILSDNKTATDLFYQNIFDSSGNTINSTIVDDLYNFYHEIFDERICRENVESIGELVKKMFYIKFKDNPEILERNIGFLHLLELHAISYDPGDSWNQVSATGFNQYETCPGSPAMDWKANGFSTIFDILMKRYPDRRQELPVLKNTILNSEVKSITYSKRSKQSPISVVTSEGLAYSADHVIITISLGVLKEKYRSLFDPPLPREKIEVIESLGFGNAGKIYLYFEKPFFHNEERSLLNSISFIWNDSDRSAIENTEKAWLLGIMNIFAVQYKHNLLEVWISAKYAKEMEKISEQKVFEHIKEFLQQFMGKQFNLSQPSAMIRSQWFTNPHFRGAYSYRNVQAERKKVYPHILEEPLSSTNLEILFAGEATSEHRFSTVDGAISSGWKAADRLINFYKNSSTVY